jgi:hypothetical protein
MEWLFAFIARQAETASVSAIVSFIVSLWLAPWVVHRYALFRDRRKEFNTIADHLTKRSHPYLFTASSDDIRLFRRYAPRRRRAAFKLAESRYRELEKQYYAERDQRRPWPNRNNPPPPSDALKAEMEKALAEIRHCFIPLLGCGRYISVANLCK